MDAGSVASDGTLTDAEFDAHASDAVSPAVDAGDSGSPAPCIDDPSILGGECPGVVNCTSLGLCDLSRNLCCVTQTTATCSPALNCGGEQQLRCDGPEDCAAGTVCCLTEGASKCVAASECSNADYRVCHVDSDCVGRRCLDGVPGMFGPLTVTYFKGGGVCRGL